MLLTGTRLSDNDDFLQYASRQEHMRRCVFQFGSFPSRSHYLGGGFPTLGDPDVARRWAAFLERVRNAGDTARRRDFGGLVLYYGFGREARLSLP